MNLADKYPIVNWVLDRDILDLGDRIAFQRASDGEEIIAEVVGYPALRQFIECIDIVTGESYSINLYSQIVYKLTIDPMNRMPCTCGAIHTKNPNLHAHWCDNGKPVPRQPNKREDSFCEDIT